MKKRQPQNLNTIKYIPNENKYTLMDYAINYSKTLHEYIYELETDHGKIEIIFLERHLPHIIGLHHFSDKKSPNILLRNPHNLAGQDGFDNLIEGNITMQDLMNSRKGVIWKNIKNKKRVLSMHLIPDMIRNSTLYLVDGKLKGEIKAKYVLKSNLTNTCYSLCIDEDIRLNRLGTTYCCISNLIDDSMVIKNIESGHLKEISLKRIIKKGFYSGTIFEVLHKEHNIYQDNPMVTTVGASPACLGDLLLNNCSFTAVYVPTLGKYYVTYFRIDSSMIKVLTKYK